jgi:hypothetical protein
MVGSMRIPIARRTLHHERASREIGHERTVREFAVVAGAFRADDDPGSRSDVPTDLHAGNVLRIVWRGCRKPRPARSIASQTCSKWFKSAFASGPLLVLRRGRAIVGRIATGSHSRENLLRNQKPARRRIMFLPRAIMFTLKRRR